MGWSSKPSAVVREAVEVVEIAGEGKTLLGRESGDGRGRESTSESIGPVKWSRGGSAREGSAWVGGRRSPASRANERDTRLSVCRG